MPEDRNDAPAGLLDAVDRITERRKKAKKEKEGSGRKADDLDLGKVW